MAEYKTIETICLVCKSNESNSKLTTKKTIHVIRLAENQGFDIAVCTICGNIKDANLVEEYVKDKNK